jgi:hypothetical protein
MVLMRLDLNFSAACMEKEFPISGEAFAKRYFDALRSAGLKKKEGAHLR